MKLLFSDEWLRKACAAEDEWTGCVGCGAMVGCCKGYPNCPGNPDWKPTQDMPPLEPSND